MRFGPKNSVQPPRPSFFSLADLAAPDLGLDFDFGLDDEVDLVEDGFTLDLDFDDVDLGLCLLLLLVDFDFDFCLVKLEVPTPLDLLLLGLLRCDALDLVVFLVEDFEVGFFDFGLLTLLLFGAVTCDLGLLLLLVLLTNRTTLLAIGSGFSTLSSTLPELD